MKPQHLSSFLFYHETQFDIVILTLVLLCYLSFVGNASDINNDFNKVPAVQENNNDTSRSSFVEKSYSRMENILLNDNDNKRRLVARRQVHNKKDTSGLYSGHYQAVEDVQGIFKATVQQSCKLTIIIYTCV